jgi:hypothetical protein
MSPTEHSGLILKAANGTKFEGSQTAGSNGDVTTLSGGIVVRFTGHDIRHANGRRLRRVGPVRHRDTPDTQGGYETIAMTYEFPTGGRTTRAG